MGAKDVLNLSVKIPRQREFLSVLAPLVAGMSQKAGFSERDAQDIAASVDQVVSELMRGSSGDEQIDISILTGATSIRIEVTNCASRAGLKSLRLREVAELELAQRVMDVLRFEEDARKGTICVMEKFLKGDNLREKTQDDS